jgi:hypothetical protein
MYVAFKVQEGSDECNAIIPAWVSAVTMIVWLVLVELCVVLSFFLVV